MTNTCRSIYALSREHAGLTQEQACSEIELYYPSLAVRTLSDIERGRVRPAGEIVRAMVHAYKDPELIFEHLDSDLVYSMVFPKHERSIPLENAAKVGLASANSTKLRDELLEASLDGSFENEKPEFLQRLTDNFQQTIGPWKGLIAKTTVAIGVIHQLC